MILLRPGLILAILTELDRVLQVINPDLHLERHFNRFRETTALSNFDSILLFIASQILSGAYLLLLLK